MPPPSKKRGQIALHMSVGPSAVRPSAYNIFVPDQNLENALTYVPQTLSMYLSWVAEEPIDFGVTVLKVMVTGVKCAKPLRLITREHLGTHPC